MRILVCGSRSWTDRDKIFAVLDQHKPDAIIHGGAQGADRIAGEWAEQAGVTARVYLPDWRLGKRAGMARSDQMIDTRPSLVLAFWDGQSKGTKHTIDQARKRGITVTVYES